MTFNQAFEKKVNSDVQDDARPGPAPRESRDWDMATKKSLTPPHQFDLDQKGADEKNDYPPRFSTIFGAAAPPPPPPPPAPRPYVQEYYPPPQRKSGVFMPMPLFVVFAIILFFESTILFAYTVIGLYNNAPAKLFPWAGQGTTAVASACDCKTQQPPINIAPNFIMPQAGEQQITKVVTISASVPTTISSSSSTTSSSSSTSTSSTSSSSFSSSSSTTSTTDAAAAASNIAGILGGLISSTDTVNASPTRSTVTSVKLITEDPAGSTLTSHVRPTITQTTWLDAPAATNTNAASGSDRSATGVTPAPPTTTRAVATATVSSSSILDGITVIPTTLATSSTPTSVTERAASTDAAAATKSQAKPHTKCGSFNWLVGNVCL